MKKAVVFLLFFFLIFTGIVFSNPESVIKLEYDLLVMNEKVAAEFAEFKILNTGTEIISKTELNSEDENAVYSTNSKVENSIVHEYNLNLEFNEKVHVFNLKKNEGKYSLKYGKKAIDIESDETTVVIDNNVSWLWQVFYDYYKTTNLSNYNALIPQLIAYGEEVTVPLEITRKTEIEDETNLFIKFGGNSGLIKVNDEGIVKLVLIGVAKSELK